MAQFGSLMAQLSLIWFLNFIRCSFLSFCSAAAFSPKVPATIVPVLSEFRGFDAFFLLSNGHRSSLLSSFRIFRLFRLRCWREKSIGHPKTVALFLKFFFVNRLWGTSPLIFTGNAGFAFARIPGKLARNRRAILGHMCGQCSSENVAAAV
jgi:hypothetical protein